MQLLLIKRDMQFQLLELFLIKEVRLGHLLNVDLDRDDEEDVNYEDYTEKSMNPIYKKKVCLTMTTKPCNPVLKIARPQETKR